MKWISNRRLDELADKIYAMAQQRYEDEVGYFERHNRNAKRIADLEMQERGLSMIVHKMEARLDVVERTLKANKIKSPCALCGQLMTVPEKGCC